MAVCFVMSLQVWTEKYRPEKLSEIIGQKHVVDRLKAWVKEGSVPNMLFAGPAGTGKTTAALCLAKEIFGNHWKENFQETNASDQRGIDVVRGRIKNFAMVKPIGSEFKIIFLDESDSLTPEAQQALRRTMEKFSGVCRFILSCVTPDTKILLPEEMEISIGDFMENFEKRGQSFVKNINEKNKEVVDSQVLCSVKMNPDITGNKIVELTTMSGRKLKATLDHPLLTDKGWKMVCDLNVGDKLVIYPHLEGTAYENDRRRVFRPEDFRNFLLEKEKAAGYKELGATRIFNELDYAGKEAIVKRMKELEIIMKSNSGLTEREHAVYRIIKRQKRPVERERVQKKINLSRIRTAQIVKELENKGFVKRYINEHDKRTHAFKVTKKEPLVLRNKADIRRIVKEQFDVDVSYSFVKEQLTRNGVGRRKGDLQETISELEKRNMIDIDYSAPLIGPLTRIFSFIYGDGHITKNKSSIVFTGNPDTLEEVKKDLRILGFEGNDMNSKEITHFHRGRYITGKTTSFRLNSRPFTCLLEYLGAPVGDKIISPYSIPEWVSEGTRLVKREFLRALFGCEGYTPRIRKMNFEAVTLRMHKSRALKADMLRFFNQIRQLLNEFGIDSYIKIRKLGYERKDGHLTDSYDLLLGSSNTNLHRFFSRIGYAYERHKDAKARAGGEYLRHKLWILQEQSRKAAIIREEVGTSSFRQLAKIHDCSVDFVINQAEGKEVHLPRNFPTFNEWTEKFQFGNNLLLTELIEIEEVTGNDVRDITCFGNHNFIANGIVSHNCNYSSRIIEPIQSRCSVFRFSRLGRDDVRKYAGFIAQKEGMKVTEDAYDAIYEVSEGDLRKATNILQACSTLEKTDREGVYSIVSQVKPEEMKGLMEKALAGNFSEARKKLYDLMIARALSGEDILKAMHSHIFRMDVDEKKKLALIEILGEYEFRLNQGATPEIQLEAMLAQFMKVSSD